MATVKNILILSKTHDIILLQETHLPSKDFRYLSSFLPQWRIYYNHHPNLKIGGTAILIHPNISKYYTTPPPEPTAQQCTHRILSAGRLHYITLLPKPSLEHHTPHRGRDLLRNRPLIITNVYLSAGSRWREKKSQLGLLAKGLPNLDHAVHIVGGDYNFIETPSDSLSQSKYYHLPQAFRSVWHKFLADFQLKEAYQRHMTMCKPGATSAHLSRLDRFYFQMPPELTPFYRVAAVLAKVPYHPYTKKGRFVSVHNPISLSLNPMAPPDNLCRNAVPRWLPKLPTFKAAFDKRLQSGLSRLHTQDPWERWKAVKAAVRQGAKDAIRHYKERAKEPTRILDLAVQLVHLLRRPAKDFHTIRNVAKLLPEDMATCFSFCPSSNTFNDERLLQRIGEMVAAHGLPDNEPIEWSTQPAHLGARYGNASHSPRFYKKNFAEKAKGLLPSTRDRFRRLHQADGTYTHDPETIAAAAKAFWQKVWSKAPASPINIDKFLCRYKKRISKRQLRPSVSYVASCIAATSNSSPGPDGIRYGVWRSLKLTVAPFLKDLIWAMGQDHRAIPSDDLFNLTSLYLLPKKDTGLIQDTRPIQVPNTDNRIISSVFVKMLGEFTEGLLSPAQKALPGKTPAHNILPFNRKFYSSMAKGKQLYLLLIDFTKAFDSLDQGYVLRLLAHIGLSAFYLNIYRGLLSNVSAQLVGDFPNTKEYIIRILSGVKQGDPASPLIFCIALDPLLERLSELQMNKIGGFMDDVAAIFRDLHAISHLHPIMKEFARASGLELNLKKTVLLPSMHLLPQERDQIRNSAWPNLKVKDQAKYLGILFGKGVTVEQVYAQALSKFQERVTSYCAVKKRFTPPQRVKIANIFLLPLFSYLYQFFFPPPSVLSTIVANLKRWIVPLNTGTTLGVWEGHWTTGGLPRALHRLEHLAVANLLRHRSFTKGKGYPPDTGTMLAGAHIKWARELMHQAGGGKLLSELTTTSQFRRHLQLHPDTLKVERQEIQRVLSSNHHQIHTRSAADNLAANLQNLPGPGPGPLHYCILAFRHNVLPFPHRLAKIQPSYGPDLTCAFCGHHEGAKLDHVYLNCPATRTTFQLASLPMPTRSRLLLTTPAMDPTTIVSTFVMVAATWFAYQQEDTFPNFDVHRASNRIHRHALKIVADLPSSWGALLHGRPQRPWQSRRHLPSSPSFATPARPGLLLPPTSPTWTFTHISATRLKRHRAKPTPKNSLFYVHWEGYPPTWEPFSKLIEHLPYLQSLFPKLF